jgi:3',5'-cyclic AMP phosphodiesterase CpdA
MTRSLFSFIHISDTHIGPSDGYTLWGKNTLSCAGALADRINAFDAPVDFVMHTGDIVNVADQNSFSRAAGLFSRLRLPVYFLQGNHDGDAAFFSRFAALNQKVTPFDAPDNTSYWFAAKGAAMLALDCRGPAFEDSEGLFSEMHERILDQFFCQTETMPLLIFTHFPALPLDSPWIDNGMLLRNGNRFHEMLRRSGRNILGVFSGHVHHNTCTHRDGILYASCSSPFCNFRILPQDEKAVFEPDVPVSFNYVTIKGPSLIIREISSGP